MQHISYKQLQEAMNTLGVLSFSTYSEIKKRYLKLSKEYHPDKNGSAKEFQKINSAYKLLKDYMDNFKFAFTQEEFKSQYPFNQKDWVGGR